MKTLIIAERRWMAAGAAPQPLIDWEEALHEVPPQHCCKRLAAWRVQAGPT